MIEFKNDILYFDRTRKKFATIEQMIYSVDIYLVHYWFDQDKKRFVMKHYLTFDFIQRNFIKVNHYRTKLGRILYT